MLGNMNFVIFKSKFKYFSLGAGEELSKSKDGPTGNVSLAICGLVDSVRKL